MMEVKSKMVDTNYDDMKSVTQVTVSQEQREAINKITNFSATLTKAMLEYLEDYVRAEIDTQSFRGQKEATFTSNKSISIPVGLRKLLDEKKVNTSNFTRWLIDNNKLEMEG